MSSTFTLDTIPGQTFDLVERPLFGELIWAEKESGISWSDMGAMGKQAVVVLLSLRRAGVMLTWQDIANLSPADFDSEPAAVVAAVDGVPAPAVEAAPAVVPPTPPAESAAAAAVVLPVTSPAPASAPLVGVIEVPAPTA